MDITEIDEQWLDLHREKIQKNYIVAISNTGKYRRADGTVGILNLRKKVRYNDKTERCYHVIAQNFLITVKRPDQNQIDHITHNPTEYNVNDVRNLRWCTKAENNSFEEARNNHSKENSHLWKGDYAKPRAKYDRALKEYRRNPTEENLATLEEARLRRQEYLRLLKSNS